MARMMLTTLRDPFADFEAVVRRAFPAVERQWSLPTVTRAFSPAAEIVREGEDALIRVELPGIDPTKDVTIEVEGGGLVIRGERRDERSEQAEGRTLRELRYGSFRRSFALPETVGADKVSATYDAGVLTVRVAGAHGTAAPQRIAVQVVPAAISTASAPAETITSESTQPAATVPAATAAAAEIPADTSSTTDNPAPAERAVAGGSTQG